MAGLMDELGKAVDKLQDLGGKAVEGAKDLFEKAKPGIEETFDMASRLFQWSWALDVTCLRLWRVAQSSVARRE